LSRDIAGTSRYRDGRTDSKKSELKSKELARSAYPMLGKFPHRIVPVDAKHAPGNGLAIQMQAVMKQEKDGEVYVSAINKIKKREREKGVCAARTVKHGVGLSLRQANEGLVGEYPGRFVERRNSQGTLPAARAHGKFACRGGVMAEMGGQEPTNSARKQA
jgi:hypothetical protein